MPQSCLCPLKAYQKMLNLVHADSQAPAFLLPSTTNIAPVTYRFLQSFIKLEINCIDMDITHFSSHSFCRGGATWAFKLQVPADLIKVQRDWTSQAYMRYLDFSLEQCMLVSQQMVKHILETT